MTPIHDTLDNFNFLKPENANAKVLPSAYRGGEDFLQDVCNETDRELIRCSPNLTDPEHTKLLPSDPWDAAHGTGESVQPYSSRPLCCCLHCLKYKSCFVIDVHDMYS